MWGVEVTEENVIDMRFEHSPSGRFCSVVGEGMRVDLVGWMRVVVLG